MAPGLTLFVLSGNPSCKRFFGGEVSFLVLSTSFLHLVQLKYLYLFEIEDSINVVKLAHIYDLCTPFSRYLVFG